MSILMTDTNKTTTTTNRTSPPCFLLREGRRLIERRREREKEGCFIPPPPLPLRSLLTLTPPLLTSLTTTHLIRLNESLTLISLGGNTVDRVEFLFLQFQSSLAHIPFPQTNKKNISLVNLTLAYSLVISCHSLDIVFGFSWLAIERIA